MTKAGFAGETMAECAATCWDEVTGFAGFALYLPAVAGSADPSIGAVA